MLRLADATSAYLRSAAHQPVDWHPWGPEAFAHARQENKPVLLDIGAVWCHWCHVMDHESYEDPAVAERLNRDWVCIKVDRDERPDVDARYQRAVQAISGQGGWPLTAFLTPDGEVFFGGTYFPPDGKYGRPGFSSVLDELGRVYREQPDKVTQQADAIRKHLEGHAAEAKRGSLSESILQEAAEAMARTFDIRYGGFGGQPKFPHPTACEFLLHYADRVQETWPREIVDRTLTAMARGGLRDHLGGGFHRYSVDARWIVPHFEKMSYDNSELLRVYCHAASSIPSSFSSRGGDERKKQGEEMRHLYVEVIRGIVEWAGSVMSNPAGGYYASQDADVGPEDDGDYFTWTVDEVRAAGVTDDAFEVLARHYDIGEQGEMHHDARRNVLWIRETPAQIAASTGRPREEVETLLAGGRARLRDARAARTAPYVDETLYTGWNAMMASAMLAAGALLDRPDVEQHAITTLERIFQEAGGDDGASGVAHALGGDVAGILDDQVQVAAAAVDAWEWTGEPRWLARATALMDHVWDTYRADDGGLYDRASEEGEGFLSQRLTPVQDAPTPSPNGVAAIVLGRLAEHTGDERWRTRATELLEAVAGGLADLHLHGAALLLGLDWNLRPAAHVVVVDDGTAGGTALRRAARSAWRPRKVLTSLGRDGRTQGLPAPVRAMLDGRAPRAYVCVGTHCAPPAESPAALEQALANA